MANNRLYLVDSTTNEYIVLAKRYCNAWQSGNIEIYKDFLYSRAFDSDDQTCLILGTENDPDFYNRWIINGENYNKDGRWAT